MSSITRRIEIKGIYQILGIIIIVLLSIGGNADDGSFIDTRRGLLTDPNAPCVFDVKKLGAKGDGATDDTPPFLQAWNMTCQSATPATILVPPGDFLTGELFFSGPCVCPRITFEVQGNLIAKPDCEAFAKNEAWVYFIGANAVTVTGGGLFNAQGEGVWMNKHPGGKPLPDSLVIANSNDSGIDNIKFLNSKGFHIKIFDVNNFIATNLNITAPDESPNTDGIHIGRVHNLTISSSIIGTGDDCISIGDGSENIIINNVTCGPGHGISIGSLGRYQDEKDVHNVHVSNCTFIKTQNGARIKTFRASPALRAANITFADLIMDDVYNPIIIDQNYASNSRKECSKVKITDVSFTNIKGTTCSNIPVAINCSDAVPCEGVNLANIDFTYTGNNTVNQSLASVCANAKASFSGIMNPTACPL